MVSCVTPALTWVCLAAGLVGGLAGLVRMAGPATGGGDDLTGMIRLPEPMTGTIVTLFALAGLVFLVGVARRFRSRRSGEGEDALGPEPPRGPRWLRTLSQVLSLLNFVVIAYLLWKGGIPEVLLNLGAGAAGAPASPQNVPDAPPFVTWTFGVLVLVAGLGALALALWLVFGDVFMAWWRGRVDDAPLSPLAEAVEESREDLRAEPDPRRAIIRCYARFERVAADSGLARKPWLTPMEFMREVLDRLPVPRGSVPTLTGLFELARFSHRALGRPERDRALDALDEIRATMPERADAAGFLHGL
jgi:hypothetical protein